jgi:hypothetical protein
MSMNSTIKAQWVAALRSGEYRQGSSYLRKGDCFCPLGVLCDLAVKAGVVKWETFNTGEMQVKDLYHCNNSTSTAPLDVRVWAGLGSSHPTVTVGRLRANKTVTLFDANDRLLLEFPEIADLIETQL